MGGAASSSSSSSAPISAKQFDVFISFRGEDTRRNFTSHLHTALCQKSVRTYIDYEIHKGDEISQALIQAIHDSSVSIVVFSENYASSKWCLDELSHIIHCRKHEGQVVIPLFYKVDPSDVRKNYKQAFTKHEQDFMHSQDKVNKWKDALFETANLSGWDSRTFRDKAELIQNIVSDVLQKLDHRYPNALKGLVGIDENCEHIELLLESVPIIGIWGMGGIGKTAMAKAVFAKRSHQYESCCFLENVREESEKHGLNYIRDKLVLELLKEENFHSSGPKFVESTSVMRRLSGKKILIVLDDVSSSKQLEYLARECDCLGLGSRVIITTRDKHLLLGRVNEIHEAKALSYHESLKLFSLKAFHKDHPEIGYLKLTERAVVYTKGIPLALTVLGLFLYSKTKEEWDSALTKLEKTPNEDIQKVLKLSYDGLNYEEKEMFLDIACFLKGEVKERVIRLLDSYGFNAIIGIRTLLDKALISINDRVWMHDLIQNMGWEIIRQECIKEPGRRSRLWNPEEVYDVLKNNRGTDAVEGIILNVSKIRDIQLNANTFKKMTNLRFLKFFSHLNERSCNVNSPLGLESLPDRLKYFHWDGYPLEALPSTFCPENLVEVHMQCSRIKKLWDGVQNLMNLKGINLSGSKQLGKLPDFSKAQNLEWVDLSYCESLCNVHPSILSLHKLATLNLFRCKELKSLQSGFRLTSLRELNVNYCFSLKEFSLSLEEIRVLNLRYTGTEIFYLSTACLSKLRWLGLNGSKLKNLPIKELCCLKSLEELILYRCRIDKPKLHILFDALRSLQCLNLRKCCNLTELPDNISMLSSLNKLSLDGSSVKSLPTSIIYLSGLKELSLCGCKRLGSLPELPPSIRKLEASDCTSLKTVFNSTVSRQLQKENEKFFSFFCSFKDCVKLDEQSLWGIRECAHFSLKQAVYNHQRGNVCYQGSEVPEWFGCNRTTNASITIELAPAFDDLMGFVFCSVLPQFTSKEKCQSNLECQSYLEDGKDMGCASSWQPCKAMEKWNSDNVFLWHDPIKCEQILKALIENKANDQCTTYNTKVTFEFIVFSDMPWLTEMKECGVCPIYASKYHKSIGVMKLGSELMVELDLGMKTKRFWDINEQKQLPATKKLKESPVVQHVPLGSDLKLATKSKKFKNTHELVLSTIEIGVGGSVYENQDEQQPLLQTTKSNGFVFHPFQLKFVRRMTKSI